MTRRIGVTGVSGFVARWLTQRLQQEEGCATILLDRSAWNCPNELQQFVASCDSIVHLAGVNRGEPDFVESENASLAQKLADACRGSDSAPHIVYASTTQRESDTPYGRGKRRAEEIFSSLADEGKAKLTVAVIPNVYGAGCRPHYNSVVATFCHQLTHGEEPQLHEDRCVDFLWAGDLASELTQLACQGSSEPTDLVEIPATAKLKISELLDILKEFRDDYFKRDLVPELSTPLARSLYSTFLSYLEINDHRHRPTLHSDQRGDLCEVIRTSTGGQVFFSTTKPGVVRGNHYHTRKVEWFCVVRGSARIRLREIHSGNVHEIDVSGDQPEFVSIPVFHTHSIENTGDTELLTMFWCNELFDAADADTYFENVA